jgi:hypothetical protein
MVSQQLKKCLQKLFKFSSKIAALIYLIIKRQWHKFLLKAINLNTAAKKSN